MRVRIQFMDDDYKLMGMDEIYIEIPTSKKKVKKVGWVHPQFFCDKKPIADEYIKVEYEVEE